MGFDEFTCALSAFAAFAHTRPSVTSVTFDGDAIGSAHIARLAATDVSVSVIMN
jgi:hypothetical protein